MQVAYICPKKYFEYSRKGDYYFLLAHWLRDISPWDIERDKTIVLDNGAYELGRSVDMEEYSDTIQRIRPDEVILPDVRFDAAQTVELGKEFLAKYSIAWQEHIGCVQGENWDDWFRCYHWMLENPLVHVIGITDVPSGCNSCLSVGYHKDRNVFSRYAMLKVLEKEKLLQKPIHILGSIDPIELLYLSRFQQVFRTDSKIAFWNGVHKDRLSKRTGLRKGSEKYEKMPWDYDCKLSRRQRRIIECNMRVFKYLANGGKKSG